MQIERITRVDQSLVHTFKKLMPQLTGNEDYPSLEELEKVIETGDNSICVV